MDEPRKRARITGKKTTKTPILAGENASTEAQLKPAPTENVCVNITPAERLALLQTDFADLQTHGFTVAILATKGKLVVGITHPFVALGFEDGQITFGGLPVVILA